MTKLNHQQPIKDGSSLSTGESKEIRKKILETISQFVYNLSDIYTIDFFSDLKTFFENSLDLYTVYLYFAALNLQQNI